jgi:hypothetical protein
MDAEERADLVGRLFALITAKLEDGAGRAMDGQSAQAGLPAKSELAANMRSLSEELLVLAEAAEALCNQEPVIAGQLEV